MSRDRTRRPCGVPAGVQIGLPGLAPRGAGRRRGAQGSAFAQSSRRVRGPARMPAEPATAAMRTKTLFVTYFFRAQLLRRDIMALSRLE
jgi:hypothetical protein